MPMQAESLDVLEKAEVPPAQARAIVRAIEIELAGAKDTLATKHDLLLLRQELHQQTGKVHHDMGDLGHRLGQEMSDLGNELGQEMSDLGNELRQKMSDLGNELRQEMSELGNELRQEMGDLRQGMAELRGELRAEIHATASSITRQMYMALLGQMAVLLGVAYFFVTHIAT